MKRTIICTVILFISFQISFAQNTQWSLTGNSLAGTEKLGSTNGKPLKFFTNNKLRLTLTTAGNLNINSDQNSIQFPVPGADPQPMMFLFPSGTQNTTRMIIAHSPNFPDFGLGYNDSKDQFDFIGGTLTPLSINLIDGRVGINNSAPTFPFDINCNTRIIGQVGINALPNSNTLQVGGGTGAILGIGSSEFWKDHGGLELSTNANVIPDADVNASLGSPSNRWFEIWAKNGVIQTSDARDKTNIQNLNYGLSEVMKLRTIQFNWIDKADDVKHVGLIAQELKQVLPETVNEWEYKMDEKTGTRTKIPATRLGVNYTEIIPVLIHAIQQQQNIIDTLSAKLEKLSGEVSAAKIKSQATENIILNNAYIQQNAPNPFKNSTIIKYYLPSIKSNAAINIFSADGRLIKSIALTQKGNGQVTIHASELTPGIYHYTLKVDDVKVDSKELVVIK